MLNIIDFYKTFKEDLKKQPAHTLYDVDFVDSIIKKHAKAMHPDWSDEKINNWLEDKHE